MRKIKTILFSTVTVLATVTAFTLTIKETSLESLRAEAGTKCVEATNSDCRSASTGQIYTGYKAKPIGGTSVIESANIEP